MQSPHFSPPPSRYVIIGLPGSGKSTFSMKLAEKHQIPVCHIDKLQFDASGKKKAKHELLDYQQKFMQEKGWIIEGCSISTLESRFQQADLVIYFRLPALVCIWRILKRLFIKDVCPEKTGCAGAFSWILIKYIWNFTKEKEPKIKVLRKKYPHIPCVTFCTSKDAMRFLEKAYNA